MKTHKSFNLKPRITWFWTQLRLLSAMNHFAPVVAMSPPQLQGCGLQNKGIFISKGSCMSSRLCRIKDWEQLAREAHFKPGEASALCCVSNRQFERYFKDQFSMSPRKWFRQLQCRLAKELMARGYSSKATAAELEFANSAHFCREFKKWCGEPPQFFSPTWTKRNGASPLDKHVAIKQSS